MTFIIGKADESGLFPALTPQDVEDAMEMADEYRQRQIEEGISDTELSADDADFDGWVKR
jgi:hypothetical protein